MTKRFLGTEDLDLLMRRHAWNPVDWPNGPFTDYWLLGGSPTIAGATAPNLASDALWTTTTLTVAAGSAADFISSSDKGTMANIAGADTTDLLDSPAIFGDYLHARAAAMIMGKLILPRYLIVDVLATLTTASADEDRSGFGLVEDGGTAGTDADSMAWIYTDAVNFYINSGAAVSSAGAAVDTSPHWFRIAIDKNAATASGLTWYIDGTRQGTLAVQEDEWPASFGAYCHTTNRFALHLVHIYYAWLFPSDNLAT